MRLVTRYDRSSLARPTRTAQGFLRVEGYVSRPGIYEYRNDDGSIRRELRPDSEVSAAKALAGFSAAPITIGHPRDAKGDGIKVTKDNVKLHEVGSVDGPARLDGDRVVATLVVKDAKAIKAVESGKQELSPGYSIALDERPGVDPKYGRYDAVQRNIVVNHLAIVDHARGGSALRLRMDEAEERTDSIIKLTDSVNGHQHSIDLDPQWGGSRMGGCTSWSVSAGSEASHEHAWVRNADGSITIAESDGHKHTVLDAPSIVSVRSDGQIDRSPRLGEGGHMAGNNAPMDADEQIRSLKAQLAEATAKVTQQEATAKVAQQRADEAEGKLVTSEQQNSDLRAQIAAAATVVETAAIQREAVRADAAEAKVREFDTTFADRVKARVSLERRAGVVMGPEFRMDDLPDREILATVVKRLDAQADTSSKVTDAYLVGRFDSLLESHGRNARSQQRVADVIGASHAERADDLEVKRREFRDSWSKPLPNSLAARKGA